MKGAARARRSLLALVMPLAVVLVVAAGASASAYWRAGAAAPATTGAASTSIYWAESTSIGRAAPDGTGVDHTFVTGLGGPCGVAADPSHVYWTDNADGVPGDGVVGRANADGSGVTDSLVTGADNPCGLAVDGGHLYWANDDSPGSIGRSNLDGTGTNETFVDGLSYPCGVAVDATHIYWANRDAGTIGRANLDGSSPDPNFIATGQTGICGPAVDGSHIYWGYLDTTAIGRANLDGSSATSNFIVGANHACGLAVDQSSVYWTDYATGTIGRADLDGNNVNQSFVTGASGACFVAVGRPQHPTAINVSCVPTSVATGDSTACSATVTDTAAASPYTPTGSVTFSSDSHGTFAPAGSCTLAPVDAVSAGCTVNYTPTAVDSGTHTITAAYGGDGSHAAGSGGVGVAVSNANLPPQNTRLPAISASQGCRIVAGVPRCKVIPFQYFCDPGTWVGNDPSIPYQFEWQQLYTRKTNPPISIWEKEGSGQIFDAVDHPSADTPTGNFRCAVTATGPGGSTVAYSPTANLQVGAALPAGVHLPRPVDVVVTGIEVTQAVQTDGCAGCAGTLPSTSLPSITSQGAATYQGVTLAKGKWTVVRVFAHFTGGTAITLAGATAQLEVLDSRGQRIGVVSPASSPAQLTGMAGSTCSVCVDEAERAKPGSSFNFLVPWNLTLHSTLSFRATVTSPIGPGQIGFCAGCRNNVFTLDSVPFVPTALVPIHPLPLTVGDASNCGLPTASGCTNKSPEQVFGETDTILPVNLQVFPYRVPLAVDGMSNNQAAAAVSQRGADDGLTYNEYGVGVFYRGEGQLANGLTLGNTLYKNGAASIVQDDRPVTSVTHEIGHGLGLAHADTGSKSASCPPAPLHPDNCGNHPDGTPDCGGNSNGQTGETWYSDNEGLLEGDQYPSIGLDRFSWDILKPGSLPGTFVAGYDHNGKATAGTVYYDFMSYCPAGGVFDNLDWISERNWNRLLAFPPPAQNRPAAQRSAGLAATDPIRVIATVDANGAASIFEVGTEEQIPGTPDPQSPYRIELRNSSGAVLASVAADQELIHVDGPGEPQGLLLTATLPLAAHTAAVVVTANGQVAAHRTRSAHPPAVSFVSPSTGSLVGSKKTTMVRWKAQDRDGDPLTATVEFSRDGGNHWAVVADGVKGASVVLPSRLLGASGNARLRVRVSDGFDVTTAASGKLRTVGAKPAVQIVGAPRSGSVLANATLLLRGWAYDDAPAPLTGRHLKWYLGTRLIGTGDRITLNNLPRGKALVRLVATDSHNRSAEARLPLHVVAPPHYLVFDAPLLVSAKAHSVRIDVASTMPATFTIAGHSYAVTSKVRAITVSIPSSRAALVLRCVLRSKDGVLKSTYVAVRR